MEESSRKRGRNSCENAQPKSDADCSRHALSNEAKSVQFEKNLISQTLDDEEESVENLHIYQALPENAVHMAFYKKTCV